MFEIGFSELLLVGVVALLVLGPERLPVAMRTVGRGLGQARQAMNTLRAQVEREIDMPALDDAALRKLEQDIRQGVSLDETPAREGTS
ncbi:twin-arginine translocase subunit TatB [Pseudomonas putida]|uniref:Sec-independent protein translocase protein TatB n=1 Tax=Pseudomonas putida TaxID=303 RepID=UPI000F7A40A1|nr:Sec-independent protein translocase protein TatB [Pseudomonas putida]RSC27239.1 twin-arginine translocase subunit TatB [Pseudomonas putida]